MLERNVELQKRVLSGTYRVSPTINFWLNERGKMRYIKSPVVPDRIIQKSLMEQVLTPKIVPTLIYDNYASLKNRGTSFARKRFEVMLHRYVRKYGTDGYHCWATYRNTSTAWCIRYLNRCLRHI